jgi:hypothetical protein
MHKNLVRLFGVVSLLLVLTCTVVVFLTDSFDTASVNAVVETNEKLRPFEETQPDPPLLKESEINSDSSSDSVRGRVLARGEVSKEFIPENSAMRFVVPLDAKTLEELINNKKLEDRKRELDAVKSPFN